MGSACSNCAGDAEEKKSELNMTEEAMLPVVMEGAIDNMKK